MLAPHKLAVRAFDHAAPLCAKEASMSETNLANATRLSAELSVSVAACAVLALMAGATWFGSAPAQQREKIPDFSWTANRPGLVVPPLHADRPDFQRLRLRYLAAAPGLEL
jgi:hypothetical protein